MGEQSDALWTTEELSEHIRVPVGTLKRWRRLGGGPPYLRLGRHVRYDPAAVREWLRAQGKEARRYGAAPGDDAP
jgi:Helix-turn-helix domain